MEDGERLLHPSCPLPGNMVYFEHKEEIPPDERYHTGGKNN